MLASTLPRLPSARKPLNPSGIHPKRAGTAWDASRPWCGGLRPMPQPTVERLEPGARALQNLNTNLIQFNTKGNNRWHRALSAVRCVAASYLLYIFKFINKNLLHREF